MNIWFLKAGLMCLAFLLTSCGGAMGHLHVPGDAGSVGKIYESVVALVNVRGNAVVGTYCTASFINSRQLATAAHCVDNPSTPSSPGTTVSVPGQEVQTSVGTLVNFVTNSKFNTWFTNANRQNSPLEYGTAIVVALDTRHDVALLELTNDQQSASEWLEMRNLEHEPLMVGEQAYSLGMPVGQIWVLTEGIISRIHIHLNNDIVILHQVRTGPGSSGSPIMDNRGRIVGIHSASWSSRRSGSVIGEAQPISYLQTQIRILETQRKVEEMDRNFNGDRVQSVL